MYGLGLLQGLAVTARNFVRRPVTIQYPDRKAGILAAAARAGMSPARFLITRPREGLKALVGLGTIEEKAQQSPRFKAQDFTWYVERCTGCCSCAKYCPLGVIRIVTHPAGIDMQEGETYAVETFDIDISRCCVCGLCVEACPYDALHLGSGFELASYDKKQLVLTRDRLITSEKRPSTWYRPQLEAKGYDPHRTTADWREVGRHQKPSAEEIKRRWVERRW